MQEKTYQFLKKYTNSIVALAVFAGALVLYIMTLAPGLVFGDPSEYTFVPHIWGISHPPGYALQTVLGGIWQRIIPIGTIAYRANLLSAFAGAAIAALVYGSVRTMTPDDLDGVLAYLPGVLAGASAATATDIWQHSIHANSHIVTALLATLSVFLLLRWWKSGDGAGQNDRWLYGFCVAAGLSVTHHPLLVFSFPAYTVFIIAVRPRILLDWRTLLKMVGFALVGLSVWLYLPLRASLPAPILFGPDNTNTVDGFLNLVLARGLRVNLFHFGLKDQGDRLLVFWSLLRLQVSLPVIALMLAGLYRLWAKQWRVGLLFSVFLIGNLGFVLNSIQDVMAYLMVPFAALMTLSGLGLLMLLEWLKMAGKRYVNVLRMSVAFIFLLAPVWRVVTLVPRVSLREFSAAEAWVDEVYERFDGTGEGAQLLAHWEHLTPLWYAQWAEDRQLGEEDVELVFVASGTARPWVDAVWANIEQGPVYVSGYQQTVVNEGFRLVPVDATLYRVLPPPVIDEVEMPVMLNAHAGTVTVSGIALPVTEVARGDLIPLSIGLQLDAATEDIIFPYTVLGAAVMQYTTDGHTLTPGWQAGETVVERYDLRAPLNVAPGEYPLYLGLRNLTTGEELTFEGGATQLELGTIRVTDEPVYKNQMPLLADIGHQVGLISGKASGNGQNLQAPWQNALIVHPGDELHLQLEWLALAQPDDNWKVFVHLVNSANQVVAQQDLPPLGGAFPTYLWFPKWVPGQRVIDPYRLIVPADAAPGDYQIAVGLYGFTTSKRLHFFDPVGNLSGDHFILGTVQVEPW